MYRAIEAIPLLLHVSVFLFLAGLVDFLFPINDAVALCILGYIAAFVSVYAILTILPNLLLNCPYRTPLTGLAWRISQISALAVLLLIRELEGALQGALSLWRRVGRGLGGLQRPLPATWRKTLQTQIRVRRKWLAHGLRRSIVLSATTAATWKVDSRALRWTLVVLHRDNEIEDFVAHIPGYFESPTVPDATSAILALMDVPSDRADPILGSRIHDLIKSSKLGISPLQEEARKNRLRVCLKTLWCCGRAYNQTGYAAPLPSYVRKVFAVPEMIHQIYMETDVSVRIIGRCFSSLLAKKLAQDVTDHPRRYPRTGMGVFVTQTELMCLSTLLESTSGDVMDWLEHRGAISLATVVSLANSEVEHLIADSVPSEALDVFQKTFEILVQGLIHLDLDPSDSLAVQFCKLYSKVDRAWGTIWLRYQLRPIHERLLETNSVYSSAWSQLQDTDDLHQVEADAASLAGNYVPSNEMAARVVPENPPVLYNRFRSSSEGVHLQPLELDDLQSINPESLFSLFQGPSP
jgi:hypothetical protein